MTKLAIILAKIIIFFGDIFKRGSALPGYIAQKIDKNILIIYNIHKILLWWQGQMERLQQLTLLPE